LVLPLFEIQPTHTEGTCMREYAVYFSLRICTVW